MMASVLVTSVITGAVISKTGKYKLLPIVGTFIVALGVGLLATVTIETPTYMICVYLGVMGIGLGTSMQILTLVVQNTFPHRVVGTATAANNYFRQVGSSLGSAVVGSVSTGRLTSIITEKLPAGSGPSDGSNSLTPELVQSLPGPIRTIVVESYNEALIPIFIFMVPLAIITAVMLCFIKEKPLATTIDVEAAAEPAESEPTGRSSQSSQIDPSTAAVLAGTGAATVLAGAEAGAEAEVVPAAPETRGVGTGDKSEENGTDPQS